MAPVIKKEEDHKKIMTEIGIKAKAASRVLASASTDAKNLAIKKAAECIRSDAAKIMDANLKDMNAARHAGQVGPMIDRLKLTNERIEAMARGLDEIAALPEPVGKVLAKWTRPNGLEISRISVPLGVIGIIYESRPNVTADAGALALKSGNTAIMRSGSESFHSSMVIMHCLQNGLKAAGLPETALQLIPTKDREAVGEMLKLNQYIDIIVPRGGKNLIQRVMTESSIPVLQHLDGNCHTYIHEKANAEMANSVLLNAKMRRTGICGATESLLVDKKIAGEILPKLVETLTKEGCEIRGDIDSQRLDRRIRHANEDDFSAEYLDAIISVKLVDGLKEAIDHIAKYGSHHTDAIITDDKAAAEEFMKKVDSAIVMHNASTQFADGGEFGMGAEIGISTGKLHARGPVGIEQLTIYKYVVKGNGQLRPK